MRSFRVLSLALIFPGSLFAATGALAQLYPGEGINVNPAAAGTHVLLYPGGEYVRLVPPLAQPGAPYPGSNLPPVHLHMPVHHRVARIHHAPKVADATPDASTPDATPAPDASAAPAEPAPTPAPTRHSRHHKTDVAAGTPAPDTSTPASDSGPATIPFSFSPNAPLAPAPKAPAKVASAEPPPAQTTTQTPAPIHQASPPRANSEGFAKRGEIVFNHDATDPAPAQYDGLKLLAGDLNSALQSGASRIQLEAYGGAAGDKGSDARRLSLKRALAIRQVLIDNGVPSGKINVRAMGGADDHGNADRVDVMVQGS